MCRPDADVAGFSDASRFTHFIVGGAWAEKIENFDQDVEGESLMLVLTRKLGESIAIDDHIKIRVVQIKGKQVRLGIEAPKDTKIHREEVYLAIQTQNQESVNTSSESTRSVAKLLKP
jgi:carbon storage regulator